MPGQAGNKVFPAEKDNGSCEKKNAPFSCNGIGGVQSWSGKLFVDQLEVADGEFEVFAVLVAGFADVEAQTENRCCIKFLREGDGDFVDTVVSQSRAEIFSSQPFRAFCKEHKSQLPK